MRFRIECKVSGTGKEVECSFDDAVRFSKEECRSDWSSSVLWLLPSNIRMAEVRCSGIVWTKSSLSGQEVKVLMRIHGVSIEKLSHRMGITRKRIREVRQQGLFDAYAVRGWIEAVTSEDVGPLPERYRIKHLTQECGCAQCGQSLDVGDRVFSYLSESFCSVACCRQSRGWKEVVA